MKFKFTKKLKYILFTLAIFIISNHLWNPTVQAANDSTNSNIIVVIDPGHGGENDGTTSGSTIEKEMNMITALAMYEELCKYDGIDVYLTRTGDVEKDISLKKRAQFAAEKEADFLFSIHYNASEYHEMYGSEVWVSAFPPYNSCGYEFAYFQMQHMEEMGLFLRGIKTRIGEDGDDYYGIIREAAKLSVPAVIIEHCYVDESRDIPFCDTEEDLQAFGRADALSVAKYFGLKSEELNVDYSNAYKEADFETLSKYDTVPQTAQDLTRPDVCEITLKNADYNTGALELEISAADYDTMLLYYDYSLDGGKTYSIRYPWPNTNVLDLTYTDSFTTTIQVPSGEKPKVIVRAYNMYDIYRSSNTITVSERFEYESTPNAEEMVAADGNAQTPGNSSDTEENNKPGTTTFMPDQSEEESEKEVSVFTFLIICLVLVSILFVAVIVSQLIARKNRRRRY